MAGSVPDTIFSIEKFDSDEQGVFHSSSDPPSTSTCKVSRSSPNLQRQRGKEARFRTESASEPVTETDHVAELRYRSRSRSAPSSVLVAARYGRELRRMSDEFDLTFTGLPRPKSAGAASEMTESKSFKEMFMSFWGRRKSKGKPDSTDETS
uniref:Uncharacterized protein n=1 Tax=Leptobrachium leishanense TaxID=445787 RepID=A0A8C5QUK0_9ANUR